jgi:hypothetical protein
MNLKLKAFLMTSLSLVGGGLVGFILAQFPNWVALTFLAVVIFGVTFSLIHTGLKFQETAKEISEKYQN